MNRPVRLSSELRTKQSATGIHRKGGIAALPAISFLQGFQGREDVKVFLVA
jgi:hypothetical protein